MKTNLFIAALMLIFVSCSSTKTKRLEEIKAKEQVLHLDSMGTTVASNARELVTLYVSFSNEFRDSPEAPEFLFHAGQLTNGVLHNPTESIGYFHSIVERYPDHEKASVSLFLQAFINENNLKNTTEAKKYYEEFLKKYPTHAMAEGAKFSLDHLGMTDEELIKMFEDKANSAKVN